MDKAIATEYEEQKALVEWLNLNKIFHFAPTNENNSYKQNRKYAMIAEQKAKAVGKRKGVSDLVVMLPNKILFVELKRRRKQLKNGGTSTSHTKVSKEQGEFIDVANGFEYAEAMVCYGWEEAREFIKAHKGI